MRESINYSLRGLATGVAIIGSSLGANSADAQPFNQFSQHKGYNIYRTSHIVQPVAGSPGFPRDGQPGYEVWIQNSDLTYNPRGNWEMFVYRREGNVPPQQIIEDCIEKPKPAICEQRDLAEVIGALSDQITRSINSGTEKTISTEGFLINLQTEEENEGPTTSIKTGRLVEEVTLDPDFPGTGLIGELEWRRDENTGLWDPYICQNTSEDCNKVIWVRELDTQNRSPQNNRSLENALVDSSSDQELSENPNVYYTNHLAIAPSGAVGIVAMEWKPANRPLTSDERERGITQPGQWTAKVVSGDGRSEYVEFPKIIGTIQRQQPPEQTTQ